jgi:hypothetical protein
VIDIKELDLPIWLWHYYSTSGKVTIVNIDATIAAGSRYSIDKLISVDLENKKIVIKNNTTIWNHELRSYSLMNRFIFEHETIKSVFNSISYE